MASLSQRSGAKTAPLQQNIVSALPVAALLVAAPSNATKSYKTNKFEVPAPNLYPMSADPVPPPTEYAGWTKCPDVFNMKLEHIAGRNVRVKGKYSSTKLPQFLPGEVILTAYIGMHSSGPAVMKLVRITTTMGNLYWYEGVINGRNVTVDSGDHITDTPLAPPFLAVVRNVYDCTLDTIKNMLEINKNYVNEWRL